MLGGGGGRLLLLVHRLPGGSLCLLLLLLLVVEVALRGALRGPGSQQGRAVGAAGACGPYKGGLIITCCTAFGGACLNSRSCCQASASVIRAGAGPSILSCTHEVYWRPMCCRDSKGHHVNLMMDVIAVMNRMPPTSV